MSGTSLDGIDVAVVDIRGLHRISTVAFRSTPYPQSVREAVLGVSNANTHTATISRLNFALGELYARAVRDTCRRTGVPLESLDLIGCHGQTIYHEGEPAPFLGMAVPNTLQIGEAAVIAERTGIPVVSDFRPRDVAAGGRGAPLVPYVDYLLYRSRSRGRVALNIGGIANITAIGPGAQPGDVVAFDTGAGNMVIDALASEYTRGKLRFDRGGRIARQGRVDRGLLDELLGEPYYMPHHPNRRDGSSTAPPSLSGCLRRGCRCQT
jgi:anhydro-N-acetylmuramic acid kinase